MAVLQFSSLPLGFRFRPTDQELVNHYLKGKINDRKSDVGVIPEVDVCKCEPWDLPDKSVIRSDDPEWFFLSPRGRKYPNGRRSNRATKAGYWKATGRDREIKSRSPALKLIGMKKTLVFYQGRAPNGVRTNWIMHEYRTTENEVDDGQGSFVLCRLFKNPEEGAKLPSCDEVEPSGLSPTTSKSSPDVIQLAEDVVEQSETVGNAVTPQSEVSQPCTMFNEDQPFNVDDWLADVPDNVSSYPPLPEEVLCNSNIASDVKHEAYLAPTEVEPLMKAFDQFYEPTFNDHPHGYQQLNPEICVGHPYPDSPFYGGFGNDQLMVQDASSSHSVEDLLNAVLTDDQDERSWDDVISQDVEQGCVYETSGGNPPQSEMERFIHFQAADTWESMSGIASASGSDADAEATVPLPPQVDKKTKAFTKRFSGPGCSYVDSEKSAQMVSLQGSSKIEPVFGCPATSFEGAVWNVSSIDSSVPSFHEVLNEESQMSMGGSVNDSGTGIRIRDRRPLPNTHRLVAQGSAPRRIRLQMTYGHQMFSRDNESGSEMGHNEDEASDGESGEGILTQGSGVTGSHNSVKSGEFSNDNATNKELSNSAVQSPTDEFQSKALLIDSDAVTKTRHVSRRSSKQKQKQNEVDTPKIQPLQPGRAKASFSFVYVACIVMFIILAILFIGSWRGL